MKTFNCKYCGRPCNTLILSERAHVCHNCGTKRAAGLELDISLFWIQKDDEEYMNKLEKYK